jgi:hypothetical protein
VSICPVFELVMLSNEIHSRQNMNRVKRAAQTGGISLLPDASLTVVKVLGTDALIFIVGEEFVLKSSYRLVPVPKLVLYQI